MACPFPLNWRSCLTCLPVRSSSCSARRRQTATTTGHSSAPLSIRSMSSIEAKHVIIRIPVRSRLRYTRRKVTY